MNIFSSALTISAPLVVLLVFLIILILSFELWMLIDVIKNPRLSPEERAIWIVGMLLVHPIVAIIYYFLRRSALLK